MAVLVAYATKHGATAEIAERIVDRLHRHGVRAEARRVSAVENPGDWDAVIIGSAVYFGSWRAEATDFVRGNSAALADRPVWFFSSGPVGGKSLPPPKELAELHQLVDSLDHRVFEGALERRGLSHAERLMVRAVHAPYGDFRDWDAIDHWADEIAIAVQDLDVAGSASSPKRADIATC